MGAGRTQMVRALRRGGEQGRDGVQRRVQRSGAGYQGGKGTGEGQGTRDGWSTEEGWGTEERQGTGKGREQG